jgi:uncharacterized cupin superfamily protein
MESQMNGYSVNIGVGNQLGAKLRVAPGESDSGIAVVEHTLPPKKLGAPLHRHNREDEISYVLEGELAVKEGEDITVAEAGEFVVKERGMWHTFWNPGSETVRFLEIIVPGDFAEYFEEISKVGSGGSPREEQAQERVKELGEEYGFESDPSSVEELIEKHGLER